MKLMDYAKRAVRRVQTWLTSKLSGRGEIEATRRARSTSRRTSCYFADGVTCSKSACEVSATLAGEMEKAIIAGDNWGECDCSAYGGSYKRPGRPTLCLSCGGWLEKDPRS